MTATTEPDCLAEVRSRVAEYLDERDSVVSAQAAAELIEKWRTEAPGLLEDWLAVRAPSLLAEYVTDVSRSRSARRPLAELRSRFASYSETHSTAVQAGRIEEARQAASEFFSFHSVTEDGRLVRKPLHSLNAAQLDEARSGYSRRAKENAFYSRKLAAVRKKVLAAGAGKTVGDVFTVEAINILFER